MSKIVALWRLHHCRGESELLAIIGQPKRVKGRKLDMDDPASRPSAMAAGYSYETDGRRAPFQVLVFIARVVDGRRQYLLLKRSDLNVWQGVAGGGEGKETPLEAALRETLEETGISIDALHKLDAIAFLPVECVTGDFIWGDDVTKIPEYAFLGFVDDAQPTLSTEHTEF